MLRSGYCKCRLDRSFTRKIDSNDWRMIERIEAQIIFLCVQIANFIVSDWSTGRRSIERYGGAVSVGNYKSQFRRFALLLSSRPLRVEVKYIISPSCYTSLQYWTTAGRLDNSKTKCVSKTNLFPVTITIACIKCLWIKEKHRDININYIYIW